MNRVETELRKIKCESLHFSWPYWLESPEPVGFSTVITSFWTVFEEAGHFIVRGTERTTIIK